MKKHLIHFLLLGVAFIIFPNSVSAATPPANATDSGVVQENLKERIKRAAEEQRQVRGTSTTGLKRGFIGTITRISEETMTLATTRGTLIVTLGDVALVQNNRAITTSDLEIDNSVVVLGYQTGDDFQPRRIIVSEASLRPAPREIHIGTVTKIDRTSITIIPRGSNEEKVFTWMTNNRTKFVNNENETIRQADIQTDQDVILITNPEEESSRAIRDSIGRVKLLHSLANTGSAE